MAGGWALASSPIGWGLTLFFILFFFFFSASCNVHGTWTLHLGLSTVIRTIHVHGLHCARDIIHYSRDPQPIYSGKKTLQMGPTVLFKHFKKIISKFFSVFSEISCIQTDLMLIPIWNFEWKLKMMLNLCYLLHLFRILAITLCSKFQLIWYWCVLKGNSILYNFYRNRGNQISTFSRPIMRFTLLLNIITFFWAFFFFFEFFMDHINLQKVFERENKMP